MTVVSPSDSKEHGVWALSEPRRGKGVAGWAEEGPCGESEFSSELGERSVFTF